MNKKQFALFAAVPIINYLTLAFITWDITFIPESIEVLSNYTEGERIMLLLVMMSVVSVVEVPVCAIINEKIKDKQPPKTRKNQCQYISINRK